MIAAVVAVGIALLLSHFGVSGRWMSPVIWTLVLVGCVLEVRRRQLRTARFWTLFTAGMALHCAILWLLLCVLFPRISVPVLVALPLSIAESYAFDAILRPGSGKKLERTVRKLRRNRAKVVAS